jgi:hypothetical protein
MNPNELNELDCVPQFALTVIARGERRENRDETHLRPVSGGRRAFCGKPCAQLSRALPIYYLVIKYTG